MRGLNKHVALLSVLFVGVMASVAVGADNLVPDPAFAKANFTPLTYESSWMWYQINGPSEAKLDSAAKTITLTGGKTFLHSSKFAVKAGRKYRVDLTAQGKGKVQIEFLWWTAEGGMASTHDMVAVEPTELKDGENKLGAVVTAPENAAEAYIRVVVMDGTATVSAPSVVSAE